MSELKGPWPCTKCGNLVWGAHEDGGKLCPGHPESRAPDADRAALRGLVRELVAELHRTGTDDSTLLARADAYLRGERSGAEVTRLQREAFVAGMRRMWAAGDYPRALNNFMEWAEAEALRRYGPEKEPGEGEEQAKAELLNALAVVTLLKLARGRMQHIVETAATAMTHAEVRMTQDVIAQIDAAFDSEKPPEASERLLAVDLCPSCWQGYVPIDSEKPQEPAPSREKGARDG